jgi:histone arginine demethylase JMJD6
VKPKLDDGEGTSEAVAWFSKIYPRTKLPDWPTAKPQNLIQRAG